MSLQEKSKNIAHRHLLFMEGSEDVLDFHNLIVITA